MWRLANSIVELVTYGCSSSHLAVQDQIGFKTRSGNPLFPALARLASYPDQAFERSIRDSQIALESRLGVFSGLTF